MLFADLLTIDASHSKRLRDGFMVTRAKAARAGLYDYMGFEVDPKGTRFKANDVVKVYRPDDETVFDKKAVASFFMKPVTDEHPSEPVTADNWKAYAKGAIGGALRDGEYLAFDIALMDRDTIEAVQGGKRELSLGYSSDLEFVDGMTPDGQAYQAVQRNIFGNHIAIVDKGRAGPFCRINDAGTCESAASSLFLDWLAEHETYSPDALSDKNALARRETSNFEEGSQVATKTIQFDGLPVEVTDAAEAVIRKLEGQVKSLTDAKGEADKQVGELTATVSTKDGEIAALNQKLKDAEVGPEKLQQMVADRSALIDRAKLLDPKVVTDGKTDAEIRKAVVTARLGDAAKDFDDNKILGAFAGLSADTKGADPVRKVIADGAVQIGDTAAIRDSARSSRYVN